MNHKIAVFYNIGQSEDKNWWEGEFYLKQINRLKTSGLYDHIDFIDISVYGNNLLPFIPDKTRNIIYNKSANSFYIHVHEFCKSNPEYKVLYFHSLGVSWQNSYCEKSKQAFRDYLEFFNIDQWELCVKALDNYECVGIDLVPTAVYYNQDGTVGEEFEAPHYQGGFWWTRAEYFSQLDPVYLDQDVRYKRYLNELWLFTKSPYYFNFYSSFVNHYEEIINVNYESILTQCKEVLNNQ
jgi:hypothetical protein